MGLELVRSLKIVGHGSRHHLTLSSDVEVKEIIYNICTFRGINGGL